MITALKKTLNCYCAFYHCRNSKNGRLSYLSSVTVYFTRVAISRRGNILSHFNPMHAINLSKIFVKTCSFYPLQN